MFAPPIHTTVFFRTLVTASLVAGLNACAQGELLFDGEDAAYGLESGESGESEGDLEESSYDASAGTEDEPEPETESESEAASFTATSTSPGCAKADAACSRFRSRRPVRADWRPCDWPMKKDREKTQAPALAADGGART